MAKIKGTKGQTMIYKTLHRKLKIEQHELGWMYQICKSFLRKQGESFKQFGRKNVRIDLQNVWPIIIINYNLSTCPFESIVLSVKYIYIELCGIVSVLVINVQCT